MDKRGGHHANMHPLVRVEPNVVAAREPDLGETAGEHDGAGDVAGGGGGGGGGARAGREEQRRRAGEGATYKKPINKMYCADIQLPSSPM